MRYKMSKKVNEIIISFQKKLKMIKPFDSIIVFILIMGHYGFGVSKALQLLCTLFIRSIRINQILIIRWHSHNERSIVF